MKTWINSQKYELAHAIQFMSSTDFVKLMAKHRSGMLRISKFHQNSSLMKDFFNNDIQIWNDFFDHVYNKNMLEIGPCCHGFLSVLEGPKEKIIIEPLFLQIDQWQKENFGFSAFENLKCHSIGAEVFIEDYSNKIDGAIYCRNMLDHTPEWPFVLANISKYAAKGCKLLLWTDIHHGNDADEGHYNITENPELFRRLILQLGFYITHEFKDKNRNKINFGCYAFKK